MDQYLVPDTMYSRYVLLRVPAVVILMPNMNGQITLTQDDQFSVEVAEDGILKVDYFALYSGKAHIVF